MISPLHNLAGCTACGLRAGCERPVPGVGPDEAGPIKVMIVGEAPGFNEDRGGIPFTGRAGRELDKLLYEFAGLSRHECYITNVVKCRPENNRDPGEEEIKTCAQRWLQMEILHIKPEIIVAVGRIAAKLLTFCEGKQYVLFDIERDHGIPQYIYNILMDQSYCVLPTYHPAAGLHEHYAFRWAQQDFMVLRQLLRGTYNPVVNPHPNPTYQLISTGQPTLKLEK